MQCYIAQAVSYPPLVKYHTIAQAVSYPPHSTPHVTQQYWDQWFAKPPKLPVFPSGCHSTIAPYSCIVRGFHIRPQYSGLCSTPQLQLLRLYCPFETKFSGPNRQSGHLIEELNPFVYRKSNPGSLIILYCSHYTDWASASPFCHVALKIIWGGCVPVTMLWRIADTEGS